MKPFVYGADRVGGSSRPLYSDAGEAQDDDRAVLRIDSQPNALSRRSLIAGWLDPHPRRFLVAAGWVLFIFWCTWWGVSFHREVLKGARHLWFQPPLFGGDFYYHIDRAARVWWNGGDPYGDRDYTHMYFYPPIVPRLFAWVNCMSPRMALMVWWAALVAILVAAAWAAVVARRRLGLTEIPPIVAVVLILFSTPVLFALERGQCDPLSLLLILMAVPLLKRPSNWAQYAAGTSLCLAPWIKVYPGLLVVGLLGLRRWRAFAAFVGVGIALTALDYDGVQRFLVNQRFLFHYVESITRLSAAASPWNHPFPILLASPLLGTRFDGLAIPLGKVVAAALALALLAWVAYHVYRCPKRDALSYPFFLWIVALATFTTPVSNDYNLCFLPLAALAIWDRRDPLLVHVALALMCLWWQPIAMSISGDTLLLFKLLGITALGVGLVERAREQSREGSATGTGHAAPRGAFAETIEGHTQERLTA
jgi:hypothetical protein